MVKVVKYESSNGIQIVVPDSDLIIGRGFLECEDKRVSRNHGIIRTNVVSGETLVKIISLHQTNPIFYRKEGTTSDSVLKKDESQLLASGDKFRLTPNGAWYVVEEKQEKTTRHNIQETEEQQAMPNIDVHNSHESSYSSNEVTTKRKLECNTTETESTKRNRVGVEDVSPSTSSANSEPSSTATEELLNIKTDPDNSAMSNDLSEARTVNIKPDPDQAGLPTTSKATVEVKPDPDVAPGAAGSSVVASPADPGVLRPSCDFGIRCYRGGQDHRSTYAHPGDLDYRRPDFPPAQPDAPFCPFGVRCYRRNPEHFREYQHPDSSARIPRRHALAPVGPVGYHAYDDEDFEDPDFDGSSSDEYEPLYDDDYSGSESEDEDRRQPSRVRLASHLRSSFFFKYADIGAQLATQFANAYDKSAGGIFGPTCFDRY